MNVLNNEAHDVRTCQMDMSNMVFNLKNHFYSLRAMYAKMIVDKNKFSKVKCV